MRAQNPEIGQSAHFANSAPKRWQQGGRGQQGQTQNQSSQQAAQQPDSQQP
jgi:hypothetical protein